MHVDRSELNLPASTGASVVALKYLSDANDAAPRACTGADDEALHDFRVALRRLRSWIRAFDEELEPVIRGKQRRRLQRITEATNPGRDLQVQLEWLDHAGKTGGARRRDAAAWAEEYLRMCARDSEANLRDAIEGDFAKVYDSLDDSLSEFDANDVATEAVPTLAAAIGERIEPALLAASTSFDGIHSAGDERAAHKARIRMKRLRYLVEPLTDVHPEAEELTERLRSLQDGLGSMHDAHVLARALRGALEAGASIAARHSAAEVLGADLVTEVDDPQTRLLAELPRAGVLSLLRLLRRDLDDAWADVSAQRGPSYEALADVARRLASNLAIA